MIAEETLFPWPDADPIEAFIAPERIVRVDHVLRRRLVSLTAVFEDIIDPHNVAACVRTCEGFGLHDVHEINPRHGPHLSAGIAKSAQQWVDVHLHQTAEGAIAALKAQGFQIWVSDLQAEQTLDELPVEGNVAIVVGNALNGISETMRAAADRRYILPMYGMVQSFNLSVALAMSLQGVVARRRAQLAHQGLLGDMPMDRMWRTRQRWLEFGVRNAPTVRRQLAAQTKRD
ncbi:MAG: TrmH family RNA methyltransferase [Myxococcota bacterium]